MDWLMRIISADELRGGLAVMFLVDIAKGPLGPGWPRWFWRVLVMAVSFLGAWLVGITSGYPVERMWREAIAVFVVAIVLYDGLWIWIKRWWKRRLDPREHGRERDQ